MTSSLKKYFPYLLPLLLIFSRSLADITIVTVCFLFLYSSYKKVDWVWTKERWFCFSLIFWTYCLIFNSAISINPLESIKYSFYFIRWPLFAIALAYWILNDVESMKKFLTSMTIVIIFITFDTWWQFFSGVDIFGFTKKGIRLTGPFDQLHVGSWISKLTLLPPILLILYSGIKLKEHPNYLSIGFILLSTLVILSVFITGERMALLLTLSCFIIILLGLIVDQKVSIKSTILICLISVVVVVVFISYFPEITERSLNSTIQKIINWKTSDYGYIWNTSYEIWLQSPFFGVGLHKYREACYSFADAGLLTIKHINPGALCFHPHNISLQLLSETGMIGFLLFYTMVFSLGCSSLKIYILRKEWFFFSIAFSILFTCFLPIASNTSFFANKYGAIVWLMVGVMFSIARLHQKK